jgi:hypothetical protein
MTLQELYATSIQLGMVFDPRGESVLKEELARRRRHIRC